MHKPKIGLGPSKNYLYPSKFKKILIFWPKTIEKFILFQKPGDLDIRVLHVRKIVRVDFLSMLNGEQTV